MARSLVFGALIAFVVWLVQGGIDFIDIALDQGLTTPPLARVAIAVGVGVIAFMIHYWGSDPTRR